MRGEGELQRNQRNVSKYRIMLALYKSPYSSEQLWKNTGIHKNTLISRLKELEKKGIILKHKFGLQLRGKFRNHHFYLLRWGNKKVRYSIAYIFRNEMRVIPHNLIIPYAIDSFGVTPNNIRLRIHTRADLECLERFDSNKFWSEIGKLMTKEKEISIKIKSCYDINQWRNTIKRTLLNERDKILGTIVFKTAQYCWTNCRHRSDPPVDPCDILIFLQMLSLFRLDSWITYVKMWEIMVEMGF